MPTPNNSSFKSRLSVEEKDVYEHLKIISNIYKKYISIYNIMNFTKEINNLEHLEKSLTSLVNKNMLNEFLLEVEKESPFVVAGLIYALTFPLLKKINLKEETKTTIINFAKGKTWENDFLFYQIQIINLLLKEGTFNVYIKRKDSLKNIRKEIQAFITTDIIPLLEAYPKELIFNVGHSHSTKRKENLLGFILGNKAIYKVMPSDFISNLIKKSDLNKVYFSFIQAPHICQSVIYGGLEYKKEHLNLMIKDIHLEKKEIFDFYSIVLNKISISKSSLYLLNNIAKKHNYTNFVDMTINTIDYKSLGTAQPLILADLLKFTPSDDKTAARQIKLYNKIKLLMPTICSSSDKEELNLALNNFEIQIEKNILTKNLKMVKTSKTNSIRKI